MKTVIATILTLSAAAPAFAQVSDAAAYFAQGNDSAAERIVHETSTGDIFQAQMNGALANESAVERTVDVTADVATKASSDVLRFFALSNDSAAERIVK